MFHSLLQKSGLERPNYLVRLNFGAGMTKLLKIEGDTERGFNFWILMQWKVNVRFQHSLEIWHFFPAAIRNFRGWLNADAVKYGGRQVSSIYISLFPDKTDVCYFHLDWWHSRVRIFNLKLSAFNNYCGNPLAHMRSNISGLKHKFLVPTADKRHPEIVPKPGRRILSLVTTGSSECYSSIDYSVFVVISLYALRDY